MITLHTLRRTHALSFSELAMLTAVPARRLAAFEYHGTALSIGERRVIADFFDVAESALQGGCAAPSDRAALLTPNQARVLAAIAATSLVWSLQLSQVSQTQPWRVLGTLFDPPVAVKPAQAQTLPASITSPTPTSTTVPPTATANIAAVVSTATPTSTPLLPTATPTPLPPTATPTPLPPTATPTIAPAQPHRCPLQPEQGHVIVTQGYGIGTHAPAALMGALDFAIAGGPTRGINVYATHAGTVTVTLGSWPAGNHIWIDGADGWRTGYSHLENVFVHTGDRVDPGAPLGTVGNTGHTTGPHLDFQTWHNGVNINPATVISCDQPDAQSKP